MEDDQLPQIKNAEQNLDFSCKGKLFVKLKIPSKEDSKSNNQARECRECRKIFKSGKALGGHMSSAHVQTANKEGQLKKIKKRKRLQIIDLSKEKTACFICGKDFPSAKSLFGHMRCHPEREWRGMDPPYNTQLDRFVSKEHHNDSTRSPDPGIDLTKSLIGMSWHVTGKRGREAKTKEITGSRSSSYVSYDQGFQGAAHHLMMLMSGVHERAEACSSNSVVSKRYMDENDPPIPEPRKGRIDEVLDGYSSDLKEEAEVETDLVADSEESDEKNSLKNEHALEIQENNRKTIISRENNIWEQMVNEDAVNVYRVADQKADKYVCITCNKVFRTHQALGGHRSSHNKLIRIPICIVGHREEHIHPNEDSKLEVESGTHLCKICNKTFHTGQALGGHKSRCNWHNTTVSQFEATGTGRQILEFDLNEVPAVEDDGGTGYENEFLTCD